MNYLHMDTARRLALIFTVFIIQISIPGLSQDTAWKNISISADVSIHMPDPVYTLDTLKMRITNFQSNGYALQVKYFESKFEVRNGDALIHAYDEFINGYLSAREISIYTNTVTDTSLNGTMGEWVHSRYSKDGSFMEMYTYVVLVNSHFYMITLAAYHPISMIDPIFHRYFSSLQFLTRPKEHSDDFLLRAKSYRTGQRIGRSVNTYLPFVLLTCLIAVAVFFMYRKIRRKKGII